ncbi:hypothetical protein LF887_06135 [Chryseobacterium sp. MEBOG06]|uniref:hypothetical protein n=1 Tax=unclassified Chryseobacterium TaxID=2593645 RepID=UPI001F3C38A7|nr:MULTISPECIES: hypothetical protein [unclassified Chryseobacterium]UKB85202.1 hypothetical protein LF887_06135 [Chryseobacterium sp. MEBOG06]
MKKDIITSLIILLIPHFSYSQSISGNYLSFDSKCKIQLKIKNNFYFAFELDKRKRIEGVVKLLREGKTTYLDFNNNINAIFDNDTIYIQNSGNSINPYTSFKECKEMYIHLAKKRNPR